MRGSEARQCSAGDDEGASEGDYVRADSVRKLEKKLGTEIEVALTNT